MNCDLMSKYLDAYIDGELEASLMIDVDRHLDGCETCSALERVKRAMKDAIFALASETSAPIRLRERIERLSTKRQMSRPALGAVLALPLTAAACALLIFTIGSEEPSQSEGKLASVVDDVVQRHVQKLPMDVKGPDPAEAATWFSDKVPFSVQTPRLSLEKASFRGARVSNVQSRQAAQMVYAIDGHRVTLMIFPVERFNVRGGNMVEIDGKKVLVGKRNGYNVAVMVDGDMAYALSSDLPASRLVSLFKSDTKI